MIIEAQCIKSIPGYEWLTSAINYLHLFRTINTMAVSSHQAGFAKYKAKEINWGRA
jgi:hypothetical protein